MIEDDLTRLRSVIAQGGTVHDIDTALAPIASAQDPRAIGALLLLLDDDTDDDAMWSIVHAAERFDDTSYVRHLLAVSPALVFRSQH